MSKDDTKRKQNVVFFIGAGFSAPFGLPVTSNFISKAKDLYYFDNDKYSKINETLNFIRHYSLTKNYMNIDLHNVEELLSLPYMEQTLANNDKESMITNIERFVKVVIDTYSELAINYMNTYIIDIERDEAIEHFGDLLRFVYFISGLTGIFRSNGLASLAIEKLEIAVKSVSKRPDPLHTKIIPQYDIITTNYDNILEKSKEVLKAILLEKYVTRNSKNEQIIMTSNIINDWAKRTIRIKKLHGSVDGNIIPPVWTKSISEKFLPVWEETDELLRTADYIVFLGYSFPKSDSYMKFLFANSLNENERLRKIYAIDLDKDGTVRRRYEELFDRRNLKFFRKDVKDFLRVISGWFKDTNAQEFDFFNLEDYFEEYAE